MSTWILGLSALYHDSAAALLRDGEVVAAASEERFTRIKHDASLPVRAARWCLEDAGIEPADLAHVVYYEKPLRRLERTVVSQVLEFPRSLRAFQRAAFSQLTERLWVGSAIARQLGVDRERILYSDHHQSHAASAFYCSPFEEAAVLTVDGVGEWATTSLYRADRQGIHPLGEIQFPHSIGLVYSAFTAFLGFRVNEGEYKVMGMAPFGRPRFVEQVRKVLRPREDGTFSVDPRFVSYHWSATDSFTDAFVELFGPPRFPGSDFDPASEEGQRYADIAASIQAVTEDALVALANRLHQETGLSDLCMAGGVALNSVANRQVLLRSPFKRIFVQPAAGDAGGAVGAALWCWHEVLGNPMGSAGWGRPGLGRAWSDHEIGALLHDLRVPHQRIEEGRLADTAAEDLAQGRVLGWMQGRFEWGPRALGHRSILADPRLPGMQDRVNASIKFREPFRPFAPSVAAEAADRYFELPEGGALLLPWMLMVVPVREEAKALLPATTHVDGSARVHTVTAEANPLFHALLQAFGARTGHPVLLNTSFNLKGEPIVSSPVDALATFDRSGMDVLYLGHHRVERSRRDA